LLITLPLVDFLFPPFPRKTFLVMVRSISSLIGREPSPNYVYFRSWPCYFWSVAASSPCVFMQIFPLSSFPLRCICMSVCTSALLLYFSGRCWTICTVTFSLFAMARRCPLIVFLPPIFFTYFGDKMLWPSSNLFPFTVTSTE